MDNGEKIWKDNSQYEKNCRDHIEKNMTFDSKDH